MSNSNLKSADFEIVKRKKSYKKSKIKTVIPKNTLISNEEDINYSIKRIELAKEELIHSDYYKSVSSSFREALGILHNNFSQIICFGIGRVSECMVARYQLALFLCLKDLYNINVLVYDPIFSLNDINVLKHFNCGLMSNNLEGKYKLKSTQNLTLFYLPHCPKQLSNNLLWANWGLQLSSCVLLANSFSKIVETNSNRVLANSANFILKIIPYTLELALINTFKYQDIFNDIAIHIFPNEKLLLIVKDFWNTDDEPKYSDTDTEFITKQMAGLLKI